MVSFTSFPQPEECANRWLSGREVQVQAGDIARDLGDKSKHYSVKKGLQVTLCEVEETDAPSVF